MCLARRPPGHWSGLRTSPYKRVVYVDAVSAPLRLVSDSFLSCFPTSSPQRPRGEWIIAGELPRREPSYLLQDDCAILEFSTRVRAHILAANSAFGPTYRDDRQRAEIWSAQFRLWAVSEHNLQWEGLDLKEALQEQRAHREVVPAGSDMER
jgi:hypothetical protein